MARRDHTAHDLASLRIDLFGETAKASSTPIFGRKPRGTVDKRGNVLATTPFMKGKRKAVEMGDITQGGPGEPTVSDVKDGALDSGRPRKKKRRYYPGVLPFLDIAGGAGNTVYHLEDGQPTAVSTHLPFECPFSFIVRQDLLKRVHRFACEYYSDRGILFDASQGLRDSNHRSSSGRLKNGGDTLMTEFEPTPTADTLRGKDEMGGHRDGGTETAQERTTVKPLHKNMFRAFDGTALLTIGVILQPYITSQSLRLSTGMLLQEHITSFLQRPPMDSNKWGEVLFEEDEKEKKQHEWKMKRSKPRKDRPHVANKNPEDSLASDSGGDDIGTDDDGNGNGDKNNDGTDEGDSWDRDEEEEVEGLVIVDPDSSGASSDSKSR